jgi:hypothetical protein
MSDQSSDLNRNAVRKSSKQNRSLNQLEQLESRCLLSASRIWTIVGDQNPNDPTDQIVIDRDPAQPASLRAIINGQVIGTRPDRRISGIRIHAGDGLDTVTVNETLGAILVPMTVYGGAGDDQISGGSGRDHLEGGDGRDSIDGGAGRDRLRGGTGANRLEGGAGNDDLRGGPGDDTMWGGTGNDRLDGYAGRDRLQGGDGSDTLVGGIGDDTLVAEGADPSVAPGAAATRAAKSRGRPARNADVLDGGSGDNVLIGTEGQDILQHGRPPETLEHLASCTDVADRMHQQAQEQYKWYTGGGWGRPGGGIFLPLDSFRIQTFTAGLASANDSNGTPTFSGTNNQEQGVDEADIVKTNGNFMYVLRLNELIIVDALPAEDAAVVSRTEVEGYPIDMFLRGDRVMIFSMVYPDDPHILPIEPGEPVVTLARIAEPGWSRGEPQVKVSVFDVASAAAPSLLHESYLDGSYINARMVDGQVYLVLNNAPRFPTPWITIQGDATEVESPEHFQERLAAADPNSFLPQFRSIDYTDSGSTEQTGDLIVDCNGVYKTSSDDWMNLTTVLSFDLDAATIGGPADSATVFGSISTVYASSDNLYLANTRWRENGAVTGIHKVSLGGDIRVEASGEVPGNVLNQFSLDESGEYFRVATTVRLWDPLLGRGQSSSAVYILSQEDTTLNIVGSLEGLAPDEQIFSARFFDDHGFVVTFRQVDPLFALDLSNPTDPKVAGELKVTGFSRYLHPVGDTHLLAVGRDATPEGRIRGLQVSLLDVSDLNNPSLVEQYLIQPEGSWNWSAAEWDHHAFSFFPESGVMAIPVDGSVLVPAEDDGDPTTTEYDTWEYHSNFWVFQVDLDSGFDLLGHVTHLTSALRSLRVNDSLYTLAHDDIKIQPLLDPASTTQQISLE